MVGHSARWTFVAGVILALTGVGVLLVGGSIGRIVGIVLIFWGVSALPIVIFRQPGPR